MPQRRLHRYALLTAAATFCLLIAGSLVTSMDAGLAVPDWPLSYGQLMPPMVGGIFYEHGHRMIAGLVGLMILALAIWTSRVETRSWVRRLAWIAAWGVFAQALLGGLTVLLLLPPVVSIAHACLGQAVFCLVVATTWATAPAPTLTAHGLAHPHILGWWIPSLFFVQLLLGAVIRHTGYAVLWHMGWGLGLWALAMALQGRIGRWTANPALRAHARRLTWLVTAQVLLGLFVYLHRGLVPARTLHVGLGALVLAQAVLLAAEHQRAHA